MLLAVVSAEGNEFVRILLRSDKKRKHQSLSRMDLSVEVVRTDLEGKEGDASHGIAKQ